MSDRSTVPSARPGRRIRGPLIAVGVIAAVAAGVGGYALLAPRDAAATSEGSPGRIPPTAAPERTVSGAAARPTRTPRPVAPLDAGAPGATLDVFELTGQVECTLDGPPEYLEARWHSTDAVAAYIGIDTSDAQAEGLGIELPANGTHADFPDGRLEYPCGAAALVYTLTVVGADGETASLRETVRNVGEVY